VVLDVRPEPPNDVPEPAVRPQQLVNLTAMRLAPADSAPAAPAGPPGTHRVVARPAGDRGSTTRWRVTFDTGESLLVEGIGLVGRRPEPRPDEPVRHLVPLCSRDMSLSKTHAELHLGGDGALVVVDRGSTNGSVLVRQGVPRELVAGRPATVLDGDRVRFGDREMTVSREP
jgi:hypothetical protein